MSSLPFLDLPFIVQKKIIEDINSADIILLLFTSTRMQKVVRNCGIKLTKAKWALENNTMRARMYFEKLDGRFFSDVLVKHCDEAQWNHQYQCYLNQELKNGNLRHNITMSDTLLSMTTTHRTHPCPLSMQRIHNFWVFGYRMENYGPNTGYVIYTRDVSGSTTSQEMTCAIIKDLLNTFKIEQNNLRAFDLASNQYSAYFDHFPRFDYVEISADSVSCFDKIQDLFKSEGSFISVRNAQWVTIDWLLDMRCREIDLTGDNLSSEDLNTFIKHWLTGGYAQLQAVEVRNSTNNLNKDIILKDIPAFVWNGQPRPFYWRFLNDPELDMKRSDGKLASVFLGPIKFVFKVWP